MVSVQRASGMDTASGKPQHLCPNFASYIIAATWSERVSERCVRSVWSCESCGFEIETSAYFAAGHTAH